jgi:hypothetical protein
VRLAISWRTPTLQSLFAFCNIVAGWLALRASHVVLVHCNDGLLRSGLAVCSYLLFAGLADSPEEALELYCAMRDRGTGSATPGSPLRASFGRAQELLLNYFYMALCAEGQVSQPLPLGLKSLLVLPDSLEPQPPLVAAAARCSLQIRQNGSLLFSSDMFNSNCRVVQEEDLLAFLLESPLCLSGSVELLLLAEADPDTEGASRRQSVALRAFLHTGFLAPGLLRLGRREVELDNGAELLLFRPAHLDVALQPCPPEWHEDTGSSSLLPDYAAVMQSGFPAAPTLEQALSWLTRLHTVSAHPEALRALEALGIPRTQATLALQLHGNALHEAHVQCDRWQAASQQWHLPLPSAFNKSLSMSDFLHPEPAPTPGPPSLGTGPAAAGPPADDSPTLASNGSTAPTAVGTPIANGDVPGLPTLPWLMGNSLSGWQLTPGSVDMVSPPAATQGGAAWHLLEAGRSAGANGVSTPVPDASGSDGDGLPGSPALQRRDTARDQKVETARRR